MQLIADRLLATGDNTAIESICCFPKLYFYEDVHNGGCKNKFLEQQINIANEKLARLLDLFGSNFNLFAEDNLIEVEEILVNYDICAEVFFL